MNRLLNGGIQSAPRPPKGLLLLAVLLVLVGGAYWFSKKVSGSEPSRTIAASAPATTIAPTPSDAAIEDVQNHLRHIQQALIHIQESTRRLDQRINQVSPVLEQNYLRLERQRLDAADQLSNSVLRDAGDALEELQLTSQTLNPRR